MCRCPLPLMRRVMVLAVFTGVINRGGGLYLLVIQIVYSVPTRVFYPLTAEKASGFVLLLFRVPGPDSVYNKTLLF